MRNFDTITGFYGSGETKTDIFINTTPRGTWYVAEGGQTVNFTTEPVENGVNIEWLRDTDCMTSNEPINSIEQFEEFINS
jgi:hypothetical protein